MPLYATNNINFKHLGSFSIRVLTCIVADVVNETFIDATPYYTFSFF